MFKSLMYHNRSVSLAAVTMSDPCQCVCACTARVRRVLCFVSYVAGTVFVCRSAGIGDTLFNVYFVCVQLLAGCLPRLKLFWLVELPCLRICFHQPVLFIMAFDLLAPPGAAGV